MVTVSCLEALEADTNDDFTSNYPQDYEDNDGEYYEEPMTHDETLKDEAILLKVKQSPSISTWRPDTPSASNPSSSSTNVSDGSQASFTPASKIWVPPSNNTARSRKVPASAPASVGSRSPHDGDFKLPLARPPIVPQPPPHLTHGHLVPRLAHADQSLLVLDRTTGSMIRREELQKLHTVRVEEHMLHQGQPIHVEMILSSILRQDGYLVNGFVYTIFT